MKKKKIENKFGWLVKQYSFFASVFWRTMNCNYKMQLNVVNLNNRTTYKDR